jgi:hypothetical protein
MGFASDKVVVRLEELLKKHFDVRGSVKTAYRYLSLSKLHDEIGKKKRLELRSVDYVNDVLETREAQDILRKLLADKSLPPEKEYVAQSILDYGADENATFILCASEEGDALALWHGYSKENAGVNVEIDTGALFEVVKRQLDTIFTEPGEHEFYLGRIVYASDEKKEIIREFLDIVSGAKADIANDIQEHEKREKRWEFYLKNYCIPYYHVIRTLMKHEKFAVEKEIRYVLSLRKGEDAEFPQNPIEYQLAQDDKLHIEYRHGNLVPTITINLVADDESGEPGTALSNIVSKIVLGPHLNSPDEQKNGLLEHSIKTHFSSDYPAGIAVAFSELKLRS